MNPPDDRYFGALRDPRRNPRCLRENSRPTAELPGQRRDAVPKPTGTAGHRSDCYLQGAEVSHQPVAGQVGAVQPRLAGQQG